PKERRKVRRIARVHRVLDNLGNHLGGHLHAMLARRMEEELLSEIDEYSQSYFDESGVEDYDSWYGDFDATVSESAQVSEDHLGAWASGPDAPLVAHEDRVYTAADGEPFGWYEDFADWVTENHPEVGD